MSGLLGQVDFVSYEATSSIHHDGPILITSSQPKHLPNIHPLDTSNIHLGSQFPGHEFLETH